MELNVLNEQGQTVAAADAVFGREYNESLVHQLVVAYQANARLGTRAQLTRADVHHSTKKPWRQKGTGRARSGMTSSPVWRGGGRAFPNSPLENFSQKLNKKMYRAAMATIYSKLVADARLSVIETIKAELPKTKAFAQQLKSLGLEGKLLIVVAEEELNENLILASRNLKEVLVVPPRYADPLCLIYFDKVVVTKAAVAQIEEMLA
ncbi:MAG: 50S ribosomal protein L4 [Sutterella parvirubra]|jgi:large subunit ribosomal protein L4|uniref:Large ribosomal subunit protein uL4 n=1 Tax=Sutterella parvirubra YIT 11816 TaxID=762967 RepID=H3KBI8_9BURK|nr:50S ribosomal protein L4 [Sutterella parvirubra]EHY32474.1 50S ribosomal protein L4 [Sutterella parvirubra YIT 11816]MDR3770385.1 50S ribosomal protein L4 [Sutterella sp.]MDY5201598.1 50S ribosomal protein L4 [Sutterella parvirubra]